MFDGEMCGVLLKDRKQSEDLQSLYQFVRTSLLGFRSIAEVARRDRLR